jgi:hypothetical protein
MNRRVMNKVRRRPLTGTLVVAILGVVGLLCPAPSRAQIVARESLATFPADTVQLAYLNLAQLRTLPEYAQIRRRFLGRQLRDFQDFLRTTGTDPDRDVDEVVLGWRGETAGQTGFFGIAEGNFQPAQVQQFFVRYKLPIRERAGVQLYAFGSGEDRDDLFFCFPGPTSALFGRREDLDALFDVRAGSRPALDSNSTMVNWEAELEGSAPQWGITTGKVAANNAIGWLAGGGKLEVDPGVIVNLIKAVLYRVEWSSGVTTRASVVCQSAEAATTLSKLLTLWRDSNPQTSTSVATFLQGLEVDANGPRIELSASGPIGAIDQMMSGSAAGGVQ